MNVLANLAYMVMAILLAGGTYWSLDGFIATGWRVSSAIAVVIIWVFIWWQVIKSLTDN